MTCCERQCPHEIERRTTTLGSSGWMTKTERCCHCGFNSVLHFERGPAGGSHGQFAPNVWVKVAPPVHDRVLTPRIGSCVADAGREKGE